MISASHVYKFDWKWALLSYKYLFLLGFWQWNLCNAKGSFICLIYVCDQPRRSGYPDDIQILLLSISSTVTYSWCGWVWWHLVIHYMLVIQSLMKWTWERNSCRHGHVPAWHQPAEGAPASSLTKGTGSLTNCLQCGQNQNIPVTFVL